MCAQRRETRIEETARLADEVEGSIRETIPSAETDNILDNIGLPISNINYIYNRSGLTGTADTDILVSLKEKHHRTRTTFVRCGKSFLVNIPAPPSISCQLTL